MMGASSATAEPGLNEIGLAGDLPNAVLAAGLNTAFSPLTARNTDSSLPAALADLLALGIPPSFISWPIDDQSTMFWQPTIRPIVEHFIHRFRELDPHTLHFCTPVTNASSNSVLLSTNPRRM